MMQAVERRATGWEHPEQLRDAIDWIGPDRILLSSDYSHWDFDDRRHAFKLKLGKSEIGRIYAGNARGLSRL
jgi:hypothetical protein